MDPDSYKFVVNLIAQILYSIESYRLGGWFGRVADLEIKFLF